jgi:hypothetical protein
MPTAHRKRPLILALAIVGWVALSPSGAEAQATPYSYAPTRPRTTTTVYPWRKNITASVFWIGEKPSANNPTPNNKSSWDPEWQKNYGGFDTPDRTKRAPDGAPLAFTPKLNPFYVALPYNDTLDWKTTKPSARRFIPWFRNTFESAGKSVCQGRWVAIFHGGKICYAQWSDVGPWETNDWSYVFGRRPPKNTRNKGAGIDISPAVRDYLGITGGLAKVHWRFVELREIPFGPWRKYGEDNHFINVAKQMTRAKREEMERLKRMRDEYLRKGGR